MEYAGEQALVNQQQGQPAWDRDMLLGQGHFAAERTGYLLPVYDQINQLGIGAWKSLPNRGEVSGN